MRIVLLILLALGGVPGVASPVPPASAGGQEVQCPGCKAKLKADAKFCTNCGEKIPQKVCAGCKAPLKPDAKFCTGCGKKVEEAPAPKPEAEKKEAPKVEPEKKAPDASKPTPKPDKPVGQDKAPDQVKETRGLELEKYGVTAEQINRAIDRGAAYLAAHYAKNDFGGDEDYLAAYALINSRPYHENGKLREKIDSFLRGPHWLKSGKRVYVAGLRALALEATRDPDLKALTRECAEYLIESQGPRGTWTYNEDVPIAPAERPRSAAAVSVSGGQPLDEEVKGEALVKKGACKNPHDGDNSCTQFGILGLHAASKCGFTIPDEVWEKCLKEMERRASAKGGWAYHDSVDAYGSMTCAGICTTALCRYYLGEKDYLGDAKLQAGLKWLAQNFSVSENPKHQSWPLYYLYSVERVGVLCATETIGDHAWYPLGARHLVGKQDAKGGYWESDDGDKEVATSFALLFLTRATAPVKPLSRGGRGWLETHALNEGVSFMFILDASGSMRDEMDGKEKFQIAKDVVESVVRKLPEGTHVGLRVYGHRRTALDKDADLDTELVIPIGPVSADRFMARVRPLRCKGMTPLTLSILETIKDISGVPPEIELVTILLTDGGETTRGAKPPVAAAELAKSRKGMKLHVVGFDINDDAWRDQLEKTAAAGGGQYFHALKAADLLGALSLAALGEAGYTLANKDGKELLRGKLGDRHELPEGKYSFSVELAGKKEEKVVWINTDVTTHVTVRASKR